jgi:hypothetical protein
MLTRSLLDGWRRVMRPIAVVALIALLVLVGALAPALPVAAQVSVPWHGEYFNNITLSGTPALIRDDANINFSWGAGSPGPGVNADFFSVRWTSYSYFDAGNYTFSLVIDDGARLWIDEQLIIDQWRDQAETTYSVTKALSAGYHTMRVEYYERAGNAVCRLSWSGQVPSPITEWRGEYYNNTWLGGEPALVRNDSAISFDWGYASPHASISPDRFSVRWTRDASFAQSGNYTFSATVDDGVRVWVGGALIIDKWFPQGRTTHQATVYLPAGTHQVRVEYFEETGVAVCIVNWSLGGISPQEVIVDNQDAGFTWGGPAGSWYARAVGYRSHLYWAWNSTTQVYHWGRWTPNLPSAGQWEAFVYIPDRYHGTTQARYVIAHQGGNTTRVVNQNIYNNQWVSLGTYSFAGGSNGYVYLGDATGEAYATRFVGFDAVKFVKRDGPVTPPSQPTPVTPPPSGCAITPVLGFGRVWSSYAGVRAKLGCPTDSEKGIWSAEQAFQGGIMFWREDTRAIYVLYNNGTWQTFTDTWTSADLEWDVNIVPPPGFYQPKRGFGKVWRESHNVRTLLGWATMEERGFYASVQPFEGGLMFWSNLRGFYVLYNDSRWERYD